MLFDRSFNGGNWACVVVTPLTVCLYSYCFTIMNISHLVLFMVCCKHQLQLKTQLSCMDWYIVWQNMQLRLSQKHLFQSRWNAWDMNDEVQVITCFSGAVVDINSLGFIRKLWLCQFKFCLCETILRSLSPLLPLCVQLLWDRHCMLWELLPSSNLGCSTVSTKTTVTCHSIAIHCDTNNINCLICLRLPVSP